MLLILPFQDYPLGPEGGHLIPKGIDHPGQLGILNGGLLLQIGQDRDKKLLLRHARQTPGVLFSGEMMLGEMGDFGGLKIG